MTRLTPMTPTTPMTRISRYTAALLLAAPLAAWAQAATSPVGLWKTIDDDSKKEKSTVRIVEAGGVYTGRVEKILDPEAPKDAVCQDCTDERKNMPITGMTVIRNVKQNPDVKEVFEGGDILDPKNGKVYKVKLRLVDKGSKLDVRGYIGMPMLGRTQTWLRVE